MIRHSLPKGRGLVSPAAGLLARRGQADSSIIARAKWLELERTGLFCVILAIVTGTALAARGMVLVEA